MEDNEVQSQENSTQELTDERMDELVNQNDRATNREIPMTEADRQVQKDAPSPQDQYEIQVNGKTIKGTRDQVIKWAQMGYGYPQKAAALNQERAKWERERGEYEAKYKPYLDIDSWAQKNPQQWAAIEQAIKAGQLGQPLQAAAAQATHQANTQGTDVSAAVQAALGQILPQVLQPINTFMQQTQAERTQAQEKAADEKLGQDIQSIRTKYKDIDWDTLDENGKSLEVKVLEHAEQNGIPTFSAAFKDFYHDQLVEMASAQAKMNVSKGIQERSRLGVIGKSPTPQKGFQEVKDVRKKSYNDIEREIHEELRRNSAH